MQIFTLISNFEHFRKSLKEQQTPTAFIPTMGALHPGHISLIELGKKHASKLICSIYVNPRQFNNADDLKNYPRSIEQDARMLETADCDVILLPSDEEIYPTLNQENFHLDLGQLDQVMEGKFRPGHFHGMLQVVKRLLDIVQPDFLIMGQKDFQQFALVHQMIVQLNIPCKLIMAPTLREADGLAMSSRNRLLSELEYKNALNIYKSLLNIKENYKREDIKNIIEKTTEKLNASGLQTEYVEIVDGYSLERILNSNNHKFAVACIAAWSGKVRLIDNLILSQSDY